MLRTVMIGSTTLSGAGPAADRKIVDSGNLNATLPIQIFSKGMPKFEPPTRLSQVPGPFGRVIDALTDSYGRGMQD